MGSSQIRLRSIARAGMSWMTYWMAGSLPVLMCSWLAIGGQPKVSPRFQSKRWPSSTE
jgi:hypothetical protein